MTWLVFAQSLSDDLSQYSVHILLGGIIAVFAVLVLASSLHRRYHFTKKGFYTVIAGIIIAVTTALTVVNVQLIANSEDQAITKLNGKMSIFVCGQEISLLASNSLAAQSLGDSRHKIFPNGDLEFLGYRTTPETDGSLGAFMRAAGGSMSSNVMTLPFNDATANTVVNSASLAKFVKTNPLGEKYLELRSGESCDDTPSMINVFVYNYSPTLNQFSNSRIIVTPEKYILSSNPYTQPDCVVIIYGEPTEKTNLTCKGYPDISQIQTNPLERNNE